MSAQLTRSIPGFHRLSLAAALLLAAVSCKSNENTGSTVDGGLSDGALGGDSGTATGDAGVDRDASGGPQGKDASGMDDDAGATLNLDSGAASDSGLDAGADVCTTAAICDGFEDGTGFDSAVWTPVIEWGDESNAGLAEITSDKAYRGKRSAHFQLYANTNQAVSAFIKHTATAGPLDEHMFGRMYAYASIAGTRGHMWYVWAGDPGAHRALELGQGGGQGKWQATAWGTPEYPSVSSSTVPQDKWICLEWEMTKSSGDITVWVDGDEVVSSSTPNAVDWCTFEEIRIGLHQYGGANVPNVADLYVDDVVLASKRIGCD